MHSHQDARCRNKPNFSRQQVSTEQSTQFDYGIWRRIKLIPFEVRIPDEEKDPEILSKLLKELAGILNWAIRGCLEWQKSGLGVPRTVAEATEEYREEEDEIGEFLSQCCCLGGRVERAALYSECLTWTRNCGIKMPMRQKSFAKRIRVRDGIAELPKSNGHRYWGGISIPPCEAAPAFAASAQGT
jgi:putative DNA primase/helicase